MSNLFWLKIEAARKKPYIQNKSSSWDVENVKKILWYWMIMRLDYDKTDQAMTKKKFLSNLEFHDYAAHVGSLNFIKF